ncbi:MAG TPA: transcriptional repressor [Ruminococcaceae bacterium]|jgi:Fur family ferric uptake transcriptional regulator|nr:transcriptional repressor [Oscillospiraceae bacterium]
MVTVAAEDYGEQLKKLGLKNTKHRVHVLKIMASLDSPVTADEVYMIMEKDNTSVSISTVYRILELLASKNLVIKMNVTQNGKALFVINGSVHRHYLICLGCHKMTPISGCPVADYEKKLKESTDFYVTGHHLEIYGYCGKCKKNMKN